MKRGLNSILVTLIALLVHGAQAQVIKGDGGGDRPTSMRVVGVDRTEDSLTCFDGQQRQVVLHWSGSNVRRLLNQTCWRGVFEPNIKLNLGQALRCREGDQFAMHSSNDANGASGVDIFICQAGRWKSMQSRQQ